MYFYVSPEWKFLFTEDSQLEFSRLWAIEANLVNELNKRGDGWSSVVKIVSEKNSGNSCSLYLKRQRNYFSKTWRHPLRGISTFQREYSNFLKCKQYQIPVVSIVAFAIHKQAKNTDSILITLGLEGYCSLLEWQSKIPELQNKYQFIDKLAEAIAKVHNAGYQYNCLYPWHIYIKETDGFVDVRLIDLEKMKKNILRHRRVINDLEALFRHSKHWTLRDYLHFLKSYSKYTKYKDYTVRSTFKKISRRNYKKLKNA